jgi:spore maturation protein CgeB
MNIRRVALIFDDQIRSDTTGVYVRRALASLGLASVVHFQPEQADLIPGAGFDAYLSIDDDTEHRLPAHLRPRAYWAIDTHRDFQARLERAVACDVVFGAQRDGAEKLRAGGIESASWLPLACDPEVHCPHDVPKRYDVAFVGHTRPGPRNDLLEVIRRQFPQHFIGRAFFHGMASVYSASRVVFNRSIANDVNMRVFEAVACGSLLVTNDLAENGQAELFQDGVHLVAYREPGEMLEKIAYYLAHPDQRAKIEAAGRAEALARHTYRHRVERPLDEVEKRLGRRLWARPGSSSRSRSGATRRVAKSRHRARWRRG